MEALIVSILLIAAVLVLVFAMVSNQRRIVKGDAELHFRDELLGVLANNTDEVYIVISSDGTRAEYVSPNVERILGISPKEVLDDLYSMPVPVYTDGTQPIRENLLIIPMGTSNVLESRRTHRVTGQTICFEETTYHMQIEGIDRFVTVLSDRTAERNQRSALEEALASAQAANDAKSRFLSNVSHDIRTPMNAIVGLTELLEIDAEHPDRVREHVANIKASSNHLLGLINDVLDLSKIENGDETLNLAEFSLSEIVEELRRLIGPQACSKGQQYKVEVAPDVPGAFVGDKMRIIQVLTNILSNAVKYTHEGGRILLEISCLPAITPNDATSNVRFTVSDTGIGMSKDFMERIFDPFSRESQGAMKEIQGTGLGMPITKSLVDLMGGTIIVESERGRGSTFVVDLELRVNEQAVAAVESEPRLLDIKGMHFLVAEDIAINAEVLQALLEAKGATCDVAGNGRSAFEKFTGAPAGTYDAILMDVRMPIMNGYEATKAIRESEHAEARTIPIIAMTANAFTEGVSEAIASGMNAHLAKPATMDQLCEILGVVWAEREGN